MTQLAAQVRHTVARSGFVNPLTLGILVEDVDYLKVYADELLLQLGVDYTVLGIGDANGVSIEIIGAEDVDEYVGYLTFTALYDPVLQQGSDLSLGGNFGRAFEAAIDQQNRQLQAVDDVARRGLHLPPNMETITELPWPPADGETLVYDEDTDSFLWREITGEQGPAGPAGEDGADGEDGAPGAPGSNGLVTSIVAGSGVAVDSTTPSAPIVSSNPGRQSFWIPADAMKPRATSGAGESTYDSGSNDVTINTLDFDTTTQEYAHFTFAMPKSWNEGTVSFVPYWTNTGGSSTQTVVFTLAGVAISNDDPLNVAMGTAQSSSDTWLAQNDLHIGPESSAITIGGTPAESDLVVFQVSRDIANDNMSGDARLIGIMLFVTFNAGTDA